MVAGKGTQSQEDFKSEELAHLGFVRENDWASMHVRVVRLAWTNREGTLVTEPAPRVDVREYKKKGRYVGWSKGLSLKIEEYRRLKAMMPAIDAALEAQGVQS